MIVIRSHANEPIEVDALTLECANLDGLNLHRALLSGMTMCGAVMTLRIGSCLAPRCGDSRNRLLFATFMMRAAPRLVKLQVRFGIRQRSQIGRMQGPARDLQPLKLSRSMLCF